MYREQRIVLLIILSFFIYGLSSFFSLGDFVTPFFFSKLIFVIVSLVFFLMNLQLNKRGYLLFAFLAMVSIAAVDGFTVTYISKGGQREALAAFFDSNALIYTSLFVFIGFYGTCIFVLQEELKKGWVSLLLTALLAASLIFAYKGEMLYFEIAIASYLSVFIIMVISSAKPDKTVLSVLSALFTLQLFLELFKYLF